MEEQVAEVIKVIDDMKVVVNIGAENGVRDGQLYLIYGLGDELFDPKTGESLGILELVRGEGTPEHIQERMTTLKTARKEKASTKKIVKHGGLLSSFGEIEEIENPSFEDVPFDGVKVGDKCKRVGKL